MCIGQGLKMHRTALAIMSLLSFPLSAGGLYSHNLECEKQTSKRSTEICAALQDALEWSWTGHAIISPGFRMDVNRVLKVYCVMPITNADTPILVEMALDSANSPENYMAQINNGVLTLLSLLGTEALEKFPDVTKIENETRRITAEYLRKHIMLTISESSTSIFSPFHPQYILRDGCT